jgi:hypothetical protein
MDFGRQQPQTGNGPVTAYNMDEKGRRISTVGLFAKDMNATVKGTVSIRCDAVNSGKMDILYVYSTVARPLSRWDFSI